ncbi:hypothetical protein SESBI_11087 [Sesbania bispinosa]|nr:hypothetical protein SESBI_11087 [Sesbania bispinosa]
MAMVPAGFHTINSLCGRRQIWRLRVKVVRLWNMCVVATPNDPFAMQVLLVDEEGGRIEATIKKQNMKKFANLLVEGQVYKIIDFGITSNFGKFRAAGHDYKLTFNGSTRIIPFPNVAIPFHGLSLTKSSDILKTKGRSDYLVDFMGVLTATSDEMTLVSKDGRETRLLLLDLVDEMGKLRCAIFGDFIDTVAAFLSLPRCGLPVVIVQLARVNIYKGEVGIQNVMNASKVLWNPDIPEAIEFKNGLAVHEVESEVDIGMIVERRTIVPLREDFLKLTRRKTIRDLTEIEEAGCYVLLGTVTEICDDSLWWYMACICLKSVKHDGVTYYCRDCNTHMFHATPRYKLKIEVTDGAEQARLVIFYVECFTLFNRACKDMLLESKKHSTDQCPIEITSLVGKEFLSKVETKLDDSIAIDDCYPVKRICFDSTIISEYKAELIIETPLKQKFSPVFPTIGYGDGSASLCDHNTESTSVVTVVDVNPDSCAQSSSTPQEEPTCSKRQGDDSVDAPDFIGHGSMFPLESLMSSNIYRCLVATKYIQGHAVTVDISYLTYYLLDPFTATSSLQVLVVSYPAQDLFASMVDGSLLGVLIKDLHPELEAWFIRVHVIRVWTVPVCTRSYRGLSVEMVVMDAEGSKIQASITKDLLRLKRVTLEERALYHICFGLVIRNQGFDRPTNHPFRLIIQKNSELYRVKRRLISSLGLSPVSTRDISTMMTDRACVVDHVGLLTAMTCERQHVKDGKTVILAHLELTDQTGKMKCVLYDDYVEAIAQFLLSNGPRPPVVVIQFGRILLVGELMLGGGFKTTFNFAREVGIETVTSLTRVLFSPDMPQVYDLIMWFNSGLSLEGQIQYLPIGPPPMDICEKFLLTHDRVELGQLNSLTQDGMYVTWGSIVGMVDNEPWWYSSCKHGLGRCLICSAYSTDGRVNYLQRYTLGLKVSNRNCSTQFVLGDNEVERLINKQCASLLGEIEDPYSTMYPSIFNQLIGKNMLLQIDRL